MTIKKVLKENEIELVRRTKDNYTHDVIQDLYIEEITTWKTSKKKLGNYYLYNILSCGIVHLLSKYNPLLFIKLYCTPSIPKEAEYFLVKDKYGRYHLCIKENKRNNPSALNDNISDDISNEVILGITTNNQTNLNNHIIGFNYESKFYEYNESMNKVIPIFFNLNNLSNRRIYQLFIEGLSTENKVNKFKERFGLNICPFNNHLIIFYFLRAELFIIIISFIVAILELIFGNIIYFGLIFCLIVFVTIAQYISIKKNSFERESTLEGEKKQIKVKRKYMCEENVDYCYINNIDLLPGDIVYLQKDESVPCDGIILEGECIVSLSEVKGTISELRKKELDNNCNQFNYKANKNSILYHGTKILNSISKIENNSILLLCINTGLNTYKANQLLNILYLFYRNKKHSQIYSNFCGKKNLLFWFSLFLFIFSTLIMVIFFFFREAKKNIKNLFRKDLFLMILGFLTKSFLPSFHIIGCAIVFIGIIYLIRQNIDCYDKSRLLYAGGINTIFFDKTGTLTEKKLELVGFLPINITPNSSEIFLKYYSKNQIRELTSILINYYSNNSSEEDQYFNENISNSNVFEKEKKMNDIPKKMIVLFLECMISCNNLEKINNQIYGHSIEKEIFNQSKWEMKINSENTLQFKKNFLADENINDEDTIQSDKTFISNYEVSEIYSKIKIVEQKLDLYPNDYYKITEGKKNYMLKNSNNHFDNNMNTSKDLIMASNFSKLNDLLYENSEKEKKYNKGGNQILDDITQNENIYVSYKLRVYKRFIKKGTLYSSAIVYNPIMKTLHFMTKGPPEKVIPFCNYNSLPKNINKIIASYRKSGYINLILATKIINEYNYDKNMGEDYYMSNLVFCGIIVLKNKLKKEVKQVIQQLKNLNCELILNTGDNIYNSLTASYESGIISSKNVFVFDLNKITKKIIFTEFNEFLKNIPTKGNNYDDKIFSNNNKKKANIRMFSSRKNNILSNKFTKKTSRNIDEFNSKKNNFPNPYFTEKNKKLTGKEKIPQLKLEEMNNNYINRTIKKSKNSWHLLEKDSNIENHVQNINSKNELLEKSNIENHGDNSSNNINLISASNYTNALNVQSVSSSLKKPKNLNKARTSAVLSHFNNNEILNQKDNKENSKRENENSMMSIKRKDTKNTAHILFENNTFINMSNNNKIKINSEYISTNLKNMRNDCVYCVSGRALRFIYENSFKPEYKKYEFPILLNHIKKFGKIFYEMKSRDKCFLIEYYRNIPNKITCMVGDGQNDMDAIMSSHVGININRPVNMNTIFCHFHPKDGNLFCIEKIIRSSRAVYENVYLLGISSFLCAIIIIAYIFIICFYKIRPINIQLDFLSCNYFLFSILAFTVKADISVKSSPLFHDSSLFSKFFFIVFFLNLIINFAYTYLFSIVFTINKEYDSEKERKILGTYCHFLCYFEILGLIYGINSINFYRMNFRSNYLFYIIFIIFICVLSFIFCVCEFSYHPFLYNVLSFEYSSKNVDTFDDKNKFLCFIIYLAILFTFQLSIILFFSIFNKIAKAKLERKEKR